ncbi:MAG: hypothetical protein EA350_13185 [Gemmatimonadales bacterium]|nr:MAG: hypothetical protein EA350_13185 [Gemmatimonadales bacterium]
MSVSRFRPGINLPAEQVDANRRYWETEESVNAIAVAMDVSKGRLYDLLLPLDAGVACPSCGGALGYAHRTARQRGVVVCDACGFEGQVDEVPGAEASGDPATDGDRSKRPAPGSATKGPKGSEMWTPGVSERTTTGQRAALGATLVGVAAGLLLVGWFRR